MFKKGIFGGTFDPIHNGHIHIAYEAMEKLDLDEVIFMPSGIPPHKINKQITSSYLRYEMVKMAICNEEKFKVSSLEIDEKELSYTYKTLEKLKRYEKNDTLLYFITGADCLMELNTWKDIDKIFKDCIFVVFSRSGFDIKELEVKKKEFENIYEAKIYLLETPMLNISSSTIREAVKNNKNISYYLPENVYYAIKQWNLYK